MNTDFKMRQLQLFVGAALLACASAASAQWMWVDAKGVKQFSDRAPPSSVPAKNILKSPSGLAVAAPAASEAQAAAPRTPPKAGVTVAEREAAYRKEKADKAKMDDKLASVAANQEKRQAACSAATAARAQLDSGVRLRGADKVWVGDEQRAQQSAQVNSILEECSR